MNILVSRGLDRTEANKEKYAFFLFFICVGLLFLKTGFLPISSGGDEVWWSESGYWLWKERTLKWGIMDDVNQSGVVSFWPPILPINQAIIFAILGLNQFSMTVQSSLLCLALLLTVSKILKYFEVPTWICLLGGISIIAPVTTHHSLMTVRMEVAATLFGFLMLASLLGVESIKGLKGRSRPFYLAGFYLSLAVVSYYPMAPFLVCSALAVCKIFRFDRNDIVKAIIGASPVAIIFFIWVAGNPQAFSAQIFLASGHYLSLANTFLIFKKFIDPNSSFFDFVIGFESIFALIICIYFARKSESRVVIALAVFGLVNGLVVFVYEHHLYRIILIVSAVCLVVVHLWKYIQSKYEKRILILLWVLPLVAVTKLMILDLIVCVQYDARNYKNVSERVIKYIGSHQNIAISQRAWLATRSSTKADQLHLLLTGISSPQTRRNISKVLLTEEAINIFDVLIVEPGNLAEYLKIYPWLASGFRSGTYVLVESISKPSSHLPFINSDPYRLDIYIKRRI